MTTITQEYKELNKSLHKLNNYGSGGWKRAKKVREDFLLPNWEKIVNILDYGCGKGMLAKELYYTYGIWVRNYDPTVEEYSNRPNDGEYGAITCLDVLEHVEPECLTAVLEDLKSLGVPECLYYFNVALVPSNKILKDGRNAHLIINDHMWWLKQFQLHGFEIIKAEHEAQADNLKFLNCIMEKKNAN